MHALLDRAVLEVGQRAERRSDRDVANTALECKTRTIYCSKRLTLIVVYYVDHRRECP